MRYSMIQQKWNKVNFLTQLWKLYRGFPISQNFGTFWYLRHLGPPGLLQNVKDFICDLRKLKGKVYQIPPSPLLHPPTPSRHPPDTLRNPQTLSYHSWHIQNIAKTFLTLNRNLLTPSFLPESLLTSLDNSNGPQTVWWVLGSSQGCSWGTGKYVSGAWGSFGVSRGVLGVLVVLGGVWGAVGGVRQSFPFNFLPF